MLYSNKNKGLLGLANFPQPNLFTQSFLSQLSEQLTIRHEWEKKILNWSARPSDTEQDRINRTLRMVNEAIIEDVTLSKLRPKVFLQGSYRNETNIRLESDIDICVVLMQTVSANSARPTLYSIHQYNVPRSPAQITQQQFKELLGVALKRKFGASSITLSTNGKALKVRPSSVRIDADIVPAICYEYHYSEPSGLIVQPRKIEGFAIFTNNNQRLINFPDDHYNHGVNKDISTRGCYKMLVRFFKRLNLEMSGKGYNPLPSFYIESLIYNCPNLYFNRNDLYTSAKNILDTIQAAASTIVKWREANNIKLLWDKHYIFGGGQFLKSDALRFASTAKRKMGIV